MATNAKTAHMMVALKEEVTLTERQQQVLGGIQTGLTRAQIGKRLGISASAVSMHVAKLRELGVIAPVKKSSKPKRTRKAPTAQTNGHVGHPFTERLAAEILTQRDALEAKRTALLAEAGEAEQTIDRLSKAHSALVAS